MTKVSDRSTILVLQGRIGSALGTSIISVWTALHIYGLFFLDVSKYPISIALIPIQSWLSVGLFIVAHDAMHGSLLPYNRKLGDIYGTVALMLYAGFTYSRVLPKHHLHHKYPGSADDPDFAPEAPNQMVRWYIKFLRTYFGIREVLIMTIRVAIYYLLGAPQISIFLFYALPGILSSFQLFYYGTFLPHKHEEGMTKFPDHHNTRSIPYGYFMSLITCYHFGYHHEHHLRPGEPWWRLPATRKAMMSI